MFKYASEQFEDCKTTDALVYLFRGFKWLGMNPPSHGILNYFARTWPYLFTALVLGPITFNVIYFVDNNMTTSAFLTSFSGNINVWGIPAKLIVIMLMMKTLISSEIYMHKLDSRCSIKEEQDLIRDLVKSANRTALQFCIVYGLYLNCTEGAAMILGNSGYGLYLYFIDPHRSVIEFIIQIASEYIIVGILLMYQVVNDSYPSVYIQIIRTHLKILAERVMRLGTKENKEENYHDLMLCVMDHLDILQLMDCITPVMSLTLFIQFLFTAALMGTTLVNLVFFADNTTKVACFTYIAAILAQISPTCYQASMLLDDCDLLPLAIFHCNWLNQDRRFRRMLPYFMQHSQIPMNIFALKTFNISLATEVSILKFSFSLFTFLRNMDFGNQS